MNNLSQADNRRKRSSVVAMVLLALVSLGLLVYSLVLTRQMNRQRGALTELSTKFGLDEGQSSLSNDFVGLKEVDFDMEALQEDVNFKHFVDGFSKYFFGETENRMYDIKLWLRNGLSDDLVCIYALADDVKSNIYRGDSSLIGGIVNNAPIFVLWPGCNDDNSVWREPKNNVMAWTNQEDGNFVTCELQQDRNGKNRGLRLQRNKETKPFVLNWVKGAKKSSDSRALYGFSYDGRLAVELDFEAAEFKHKFVRVYIQNEHFRDNVRKFTACINSYLNYYHEEKVKEKELLSAERERILDSIKKAK